MPAVTATMKGACPSWKGATKLPASRTHPAYPKADHSARADARSALPSVAATRTATHPRAAAQSPSARTAAQA